MNANATSVSLNYDQVRVILQDWLNTNLLRTPHQVVDIDLQQDRVGDLTVAFFNLALAATNGAASPTPPEAPPAAQPAAAAPKRRRATTRIVDSVRREIITLRQQGHRTKAIAEQFSISEATVYDIMAEHRRTAGETTHAD